MRAVLLVVWILLVGVSACRRLPPPSSSPAAGPSETPAESALPPRAAPDTTSASVAAIVDSIRRAVRDSMDAASGRRDSARRDAIEAARRDSIALAAARDSTARADSIAAAARADSIAVAARADSVARADSIAAVARRDSVAAARADSIAAAALGSIRDARADSIASAIADSVLAARSAREEPADVTEEALPADEEGAGGEAADDLEELRALGPAFIPYDEGPRAIWDTETQATLTKTLLPVLRSEGLEARTRATFWVLVSAHGEVAELVLQTTSASEAFDDAAAEFARQLRYRPAVRSGRPVAVWVLRSFSLVMQ